MQAGSGGTTDSTEIRVVPGRKFQPIRGFGGAVTEAAAYTLSRLPENTRHQIISDYYDPTSGHGYVMSRVHIHSCDFSLENYTYVADGDRSLGSFDMAREERWVLPVLRRAQLDAGRPLFLLASPWSPPGWMKTNGDMNGGGSLLPEFRRTWADYVLRYLQSMSSRGAPVAALSVQNEPAAVQVWDSCIYSAREERDFVRDYLGPALHQSQLADVKLLIWDHNRDLVFERAKDVLSDTAASQYVWGVAHHWYNSEEFDNLSRVHDAFPEKHLIFTEGCQEGGVHLGEWYTGERYGRNIIGDLRNWVEGWIDWNIVLNETGGPNHVGNYCDAPIIADTRSGEIHYNSSYWYIGHFSRFVPPGSVRIESVGSGDAANPTHCAFETPSGDIVVVIMNESDVDMAVDLQFLALDDEKPALSRTPTTNDHSSRTGVHLELPGHSIITAVL